MPAVSVVIATRNYGKYLAGAIRSVLQQTWTDLELIVIDDGSTDDTPRVVREFNSEPRMRYIRTDGLGQSRAKNLGIQLSSAPLIAFLDGDDEWLPTKLERQLPLFVDADVGVVYAHRVTMDEDGQDIERATSPLVRGRIYDDLLRANPICFSSIIVRRYVFEAIGMFDPHLSLAIDYDLWLRVARHFEFDFVDLPLVRYRTGHLNLSSRITERIASVLTILNRSLVGRGNAKLADRAAQAEAWGSTCRTMGYVLRSNHPLQSTKWYLQAAWYDRRWFATLKACLRMPIGR